MSIHISDEAVEAVAGELYRREGYWGSVADSPPWTRRRLRRLALRLLVFASPYLTEED